MTNLQHIQRQRWIHHLGLKSNQYTTYTKTEVDNMLSLKATTTYVDDQLALTYNQSTTCAKQKKRRKLTQPSG
ncbi:MAG: hypothetical protein ACKPKO_16300 [Candidatus Fonsibacter sp.]